MNDVKMLFYKHKQIKTNTNNCDLCIERINVHKYYG